MHIIKEKIILIYTLEDNFVMKEKDVKKYLSGADRVLTFPCEKNRPPAPKTKKEKAVEVVSEYNT